MLVFRYLYVSVCAFLLVSCVDKEQSSNSLSKNDAKQVAKPVEVTIATVQQKTFNHELLCNGTLEAARSAKVGFEQQGTIQQVLVRGGQHVVAGELLATIENSTQKLALERAQNSLAVAKVEMQDFILGYSPNADTANIPAQVMNTARTRSGYNEAVLAMREAELQLAKTRITSPISGTVADLQAKANHQSSGYDYLCQVIDETSLQVVFSVLETEMNMATLGAEVEVYPFTNTSERCKAVITEVNRLVDENGMVRVVAKLSNTPKSFIAGMNVRAMIRKPLSNQLVIPIDGLARRQNRDVVFVAVDSLAIWKYVEVGERNSTEVVIKSGINIGDKVIVSGNATIGHEAKINY